MKKTFKILVATISMVFALVAVVSCAKKSTGDSIKIGGVFPLSGDVAVYGIDCRNGVDLAIKEINAAGGINGQLLQIISEDDEGNPDKSVNAYTKLTTQDGVKIVIGSLTSGCTLAITERAQAQKVLLVAPAASNAAITNAGNYIFRTCFIDPFQGTVGGKFAAETLGTQKAAILYDIGNDYSVGLYENFKTAFESTGGKVVAVESYASGEKDFNAQITKIKQQNPDVVYLPDYYNTVSLIAKQLRAQGIYTPLVGADGWDGLQDNAGDEVLNGFFTNNYAGDSTDPAVVKFVAAYKAAYKADPTQFAALGYDSLYMIKDALVSAGTSDVAAVRAALEKTNNRYVTGNITFDSKRNPIKSVVIVELVKGKNGTLTTQFKTTVNP
jgi:branched-chain amino acid transport system substrate-binding protein